MKLSGFGWVRGMNSVIRLCLCLVLIVLTTAGAIVYTQRSYTGGMLPGIQVCQAEPLQQNETDSAPAAIGGNGPIIQVFKAAPMVLDTATSAAVYTFKVKRATNVQINEAGNNIKNISNPSGATLQGTATGLPAAAITADASGKFVCTIVASNEYGTDTKALELSLAANLIPAGQPGATENQTEKRSPKWLPQFSTPGTPTLSTTTRNTPDFFKCPNSCAYCLKPSEAANLGFTQKCSDQRCYYSPDNQQSWYCYSEPVGWCCNNFKVSQSTKSQCTQSGGSYWSTNQNEVIQACQPTGYCCLNGQVYYPATQAQCAQNGGSYWSTNQAQVMERCQPPTCWCCTPYRGTAFAAGGQVTETTQAQCAQMGGTCYASQAQAAAACSQTTPTRPTTPNIR